MWNSKCKMSNAVTQNNMKCNKHVGTRDRVKMLIRDDVSNTENYDVFGLPLQG